MSHFEREDLGGDTVPWSGGLHSWPVAGLKLDQDQTLSCEKQKGRVEQ